MVFHLYLMRHAKSDWSSPGTSDHDRPINERGQRNAERIGQWMQDNQYIPESIVSSSAIRARQTIERVSEQWRATDPINIIYDKELYLANPNTLVQCIHKYKQGLQSLMLVAHNPGLDQLVNYLASKAAKKGVQEIDMTTANLAIFEYPDNNCDVKIDKAKLLEFIKPKELA